MIPPVVYCDTDWKTYSNDSPCVLRHRLVHRLGGPRELLVLLPDGFLLRHKVAATQIHKFVVVHPHSCHHHALRRVDTLQVVVQHLLSDEGYVLLGADLGQSQRVVSVCCLSAHRKT